MMWLSDTDFKHCYLFRAHNRHRRPTADLAFCRVSEKLLAIKATQRWCKPRLVL